MGRIGSDRQRGQGDREKVLQQFAWRHTNSGGHRYSTDPQRSGASSASSASAAAERRHRTRSLLWLKTRTKPGNIARQGTSERTERLVVFLPFRRRHERNWCRVSTDAGGYETARGTKEGRDRESPVDTPVRDHPESQGPSPVSMAPATD